MHNLSVLLIDADATVRLIFERILCEALDVRTAADTDSAFDRISDGWIPDVVIIDPSSDVDAAAALHRVRAHAHLGQRPRLVLSSTEPDPGEKFVSKPFDPLTLDQRLRTLSLAA